MKKSKTPSEALYDVIGNVKEKYVIEALETQTMQDLTNENAECHKATIKNSTAFHQANNITDTIHDGRVVSSENLQKSTTKESISMEKKNKSRRSWIIIAAAAVLLIVSMTAVMIGAFMTKKPGDRPTTVGTETDQGFVVGNNSSNEPSLPMKLLIKSEKSHIHIDDPLTVTVEWINVSFMIDSLVRLVPIKANAEVLFEKETVLRIDDCLQPEYWNTNSNSCTFTIPANWRAYVDNWPFKDRSEADRDENIGGLCFSFQLNLSFDEDQLPEGVKPEENYFVSADLVYRIDGDDVYFYGSSYELHNDPRFAN